VVSVDDTVEALAAMARAWVEVLNPKVLAVTGSVGKSTTKDLIAAVCRSRYRTHCTPGNLNNILGLSLTCLKLLPKHEALVVEMGTSAPGEIEDLCRIAGPDVGIVTAVRAAHIEGFGSIENVARAKSELVAAVPPNGNVVLNADDELVARMGKGTKARVWTFGKEDEADVRIVEIDVGQDGRTRATFRVGGKVVEARLALVGSHQAYNAAAALAAGAVLGIDSDACCNAMATVVPGEHRMQFISVGGIRILDDCYNASPDSVSAALTALSCLDAPDGRRLAVIGDMAELGVLNEEAHVAVGRDFARGPFDILVAVGRNASLMAGAALQGGMPRSLVFEAQDALAAADVTEALVDRGDLVLVKGSRSVGLELVVDRLVDRFRGNNNKDDV